MSTAWPRATPPTLPRLAHPRIVPAVGTAAHMHGGLVTARHSARLAPLGPAAA